MQDRGERWSITSDMELSIALANLRKRAVADGFAPPEATRLVTAASELGRNILKYANRGHLRCSSVDKGLRTGIELSAIDDGPGIADVERAMEDNFSSSGTLGMGLPGVKRLVDEFEIETAVSLGTTVTFRLWRR